MDTEIVYLGHDNTIDLQLKASSSAASLAGVTNITATFDDTVIDGSSSATSGAITWSGSGYATGEVRLTLGAQSIEPQRYDVPIVVYDATNTTGIVWDIIPIRVRPELEATP